MDIVYIFRFGKLNSSDLKYSLRSLEKNFKYDKIFIVGDRPGWITGINHINVRDKTENRHYNTGYKFYKTSCIKELSEDFIVMHDDFYIMQPVVEIKNYFVGTLKDKIEKTANRNSHWENMKNVYNIFPDGLNYELHKPFKLNKNKLKNLFKKFPLSQTFCVNSLYGNYYKIEAEKAEDFKIKGYEQLLKIEKENVTFLSSSEVFSKTKEFITYMDKKFPNKSKYEK